MNKVNFNPGDNIKVFIKDPQESKVRATPFEGTVIAIKGGKSNQTVTVRKIASAQVAVERIFPIESPIIEKITVLSKGRVRRAKLYHLRKKNR